MHAPLLDSACLLRLPGAKHAFDVLGAWRVRRNALSGCGAYALGAVMCFYGAARIGMESTRSKYLASQSGLAEVKSVSIVTA